MQLIDKLTLAAHHFRQSVNIVRHIECIVPCAPLVKTGHRLKVLTLTRIERCQETAVGIDRPQCTALLGIIVPPSSRTPAQLFGEILLSTLLCEPCESIVSHIILQGMTYGVVTGIVTGKISERDVALFDIRIIIGTHGIVLALCRGRFLHCSISRIHIKVGEPLAPGVNYDRNSRIALHSESLTSEKFPFREPAPFL